MNAVRYIFSTTEAQERKQRMDNKAPFLCGSVIKKLFTLLALLTIATPAWAVAEIQSWQMNNGLRVLLMEAHQVPMVVMRLTLPAGSSMDAPGKGGTATMLAAMLGDHTKIHHHAAWADYLDAQAIRLGSGASRDSMSIGLTVLKEALPQGVGALSEALLQPGWSRKRFKKMRSDAISANKKSLEQPQVQAAIAIGKLLYGDHPYGHRSGGDAASLAAITMRDMKQLYRDQVTPDAAVLAVSGDVTMAELHKLLAPLAAWHGTAKHHLSDISATANPAPIKQHITMATQQATVALVRIGLDRQAPDLFPTLLMNHILGGGGFSSKLMMQVREKRGLVYGVYSYFEPLSRPGPFVISLQTRADQTQQALKVVRQVMARMAAGKINHKAIHAAKANLTGSFTHRLDSNGKRVGLMSMIGYYHLPLDYLQNWRARIEAITLAQVQVSAARYLKASDWSEVIVGPKSVPHQRHISK
ncbi:MAG: pitrilysin family protein [Mariprofundales bacterium]|nr:pitrilysin family protein [Mariprofundales bacterium]